jgi:hypothetical protein
MSRPLAALAFATLSALAAGGCAGERPPPTELASIPACPESQESGCESGKPLCAPDSDGTCLMCRCSEYAALPTDSPALVVARSALGGNTPTPHVYGP